MREIFASNCVRLQPFRPLFVFVFAIAPLRLSLRVGGRQTPAGYTALVAGLLVILPTLSLCELTVFYPRLRRPIACYVFKPVWANTCNVTPHANAHPLICTHTVDRAAQCCLPRAHIPPLPPRSRPHATYTSSRHPPQHTVTPVHPPWRPKRGKSRAGPRGSSTAPPPRRCPSWTRTGLRSPCPPPGGWPPLPTRCSCACRR